MMQNGGLIDVAERNTNPSAQRASVRAKFRPDAPVSAAKVRQFRLGNVLREAGAGGSNPLSPTTKPPFIEHCPSGRPRYRPCYGQLLRLRSACVRAEIARLSETS